MVGLVRVGMIRMREQALMVCGCMCVLAYGWW